MNSVFLYYGAPVSIKRQLEEDTAGIMPWVSGRGGCIDPGLNVAGANVCGTRRLGPPEAQQHYQHA